MLKPTVSSDEKCYTILRETHMLAHTLKNPDVSVLLLYHRYVLSHNSHDSGCRDKVFPGCGTNCGHMWWWCT